MLAVARTAHPGIAFLQGDAEALPCADAAYDAVVANFGVHHVPRPLLALAEAFRVLRSGGRIAVSFWADPAQNIAWKLLLDAVRRHGDAAASGAPAPGGGFGSVRQIMDALRDAGFASLQAQLERRVWRHRDAASLVAALRAGYCSDGRADRRAVARRLVYHCRQHRCERRRLARRGRAGAADRRGDRLGGEALTR